jgi:hypothetical protein
VFGEMDAGSSASIWRWDDPAHATLLQSLLAGVVDSGGICTTIILVGLARHVAQLVVSIRNREKLRDVHCPRRRDAKFTMARSLGQLYETIASSMI